jgi:lysozyme
MNLNVVDISHHNTLVGSAPFAALKSAGILGVIHKASEGLSYVDRECARRRDACEKAGLLWGTYHFLHSGNIAGQVRHYLEVTKPGPNTLLALDHEADATIDEVRAFLQGIIDATGRKAVIYSGHVLKQQLRKPDAFLSSHRLWLAQYGPRAVCPPGWSTPWLWQFAESGAVNGLSGEVDHNYYAGTADQLAREWAGT